MINDVKSFNKSNADLFGTEEGNRKELLSKNLLAKIRKEVKTLKSLELDTELNLSPVNIIYKNK